MFQDKSGSFGARFSWTFLLYERLILPKNQTSYAVVLTDRNGSNPVTCHR